MFGINDDDKPLTDAPASDQPAVESNRGDRPDDTRLRPDDSSLSAAADTNVPEEDLLSIKAQALSSLAPLIGHLNQSPEEKFKTTMMMIQASDNAELIQEAYQAARRIEDEKARAQALLDVINEINYFTQKNKS